MLHVAVLPATVAMLSNNNIHSLIYNMTIPNCDDSGDVIDEINLRWTTLHPNHHPNHHQSHY